MPGQLRTSQDHEGWTITGTDQNASASHRKAFDQRHPNGGNCKDVENGTARDSIPRKVAGKAGQDHKAEQAFPLDLGKGN
jgi:hypothetical protein